MNKEAIMKLSRSVKKHIRLEKARIRRQFLDPAEQQEHIQKLYEQFLPDKKEETKTKNGQ